MDRADKAGDEQARIWNGRGGQAWVEVQPLLDRLFEPFEDRLLEAVAAGSEGRVLDIGCGTGATTLAAARRLGPAGRCTGIDISEPMIAAARARAAREGTPADFLCADAQRHAFEPESFDGLISRFGVMFFDEPVQAFASLRRAARPGAALRFVAWRSPAENAFMTTAERAAAPLLPSLPARRPDAPGQFAFAQRERVARILAESGWAGAEIRPLDVACSLPEAELLRYVTRLGPLGLILPEVAEPARSAVIRQVRAAFDPFVQGGEARFTAACWLVDARAPAAGRG